MNTKNNANIIGGIYVVTLILILLSANLAIISSLFQPQNKQQLGQMFSVMFVLAVLVLLDFIFCLILCRLLLQRTHTHVSFKYKIVILLITVAFINMIVFCFAMTAKQYQVNLQMAQPAALISGIVGISSIVIGILMLN